MRQMRHGVCGMRNTQNSNAALRTPHSAYCNGKASTLLVLCGALFLMAGIGGSLWVAMLHRQTVERLQQARTALEAKSQTVAGLEEERQRLSTDYETLKTRWTKTDDELKQVSAASTQTKTELASVTNERSALQAQVEQLHRQMEEASRRRASWEAHMTAAAASGLTRAELEQLSDLTVLQDRRADELQQRMEALSHAFEQLAWKHIELQEATGQGAPPGPSPSLAESAEASAADGAPISRREAKQHQRQAEELAKRYRHIGEFCLAAYQYPRAADAFERSLTYKDDPKVHATLAFLYGRLLPNPEKAAWHADRAPSGAITAQAVLDPTTQAEGFPRKTHKLVWRWLTR